MKYTAVFFDLDGTLTESGIGIRKSFIYAFEKMGLELDRERDLDVIIGPPLSGSFLSFGVPEERVDEAIRTYRERYLTIGKYENNPYEGIEDLLIRLKDDGLKLYVATSKPEKLAVDILEHFDLAKYFDEIAGATFDGTRGTKEEVILYLLDKVKLNGTAVMIGDTKFDIIGAKQTGLDAIGVSWGYGRRESMEEAGAEGIADTMDELYTLISGHPARCPVTFDGAMKTVLYFPDDTRLSTDLQVHDHVVLNLADSDGSPVRIRLEITRHTFFELVGERMICGSLLDYPDTHVRAEIRLHRNPAEDTVELFPCALTSDI